MFRKTFITTLLALSVSLVFSQTTDKQNLDLDECTKLALKNNPGLLANGTEIEISEKQVNIKNSKLLPSVTFSSEYSFTDQYSELNDYQIANASLQVYQPLWQNGKNRVEIKQSKIGHEASLSSFRINQSNLVLLVNQAYINYIWNRKLAILANIMAKNLSITVDAANERLKAGISKRSDLLKAQTEYSNALYLAIQMETSEKKALQSLLQITGYPLDSEIMITDSLVDYYDVLEGISNDSLYNLASQYLPEFQLINKQIEQQDLSIIIERKSMYPEIGAFGNYSYLKSPVLESGFVSSAGLTLKMDLFTGLRKKNLIAIEKIKSEQLNYQQKETNRMVYSDIKMAKMALTEAREKINNAKTQTESSNESFQTINQQYLNGLSSMLELIDAQYADFRANQNYTNALAEYYLAVALLKRNTGLISNEYCK